MPFFTQGQLNTLRQYGYKGLTRPFVLQRKTRVENAYGTEDTWTTVHEGMGWLRMMNKPHTREQAGLIEGAVSIFRFHTNVEVHIDEGDRILMEGYTYVVHDVNDDDTIQVFRTALCRRMQ